MKIVTKNKILGNVLEAIHLKQRLKVGHILEVPDKFWDWSTALSERPFDSKGRKNSHLLVISSWIRAIYEHLWHWKLLSGSIVNTYIFLIAYIQYIFTMYAVWLYVWRHHRDSVENPYHGRTYCVLDDTRLVSRSLIFRSWNK